MTHVQKVGGGYGGPVTVLCRFVMSDGQERFVVGFKPEGGYGECAHIFSRAQLSGLLPDSASDQSPLDYNGVRNIRVAEKNGFSTDPTSISDAETIRMRAFYDAHCPDCKQPSRRTRLKLWCRRVFLSYGINKRDQERDKFASDYLDYAQKILIATGRVRSF